MSRRARLVYTYEGERDPALEAEVQRLFPGATRAETASGMQGVTAVTLDLSDDPPAEKVGILRALPRILDAALGSLGEGV